LAALALALSSTRFQVPEPGQILCRRLESLLSEVKAGRKDAVDSFWVSVKGNTPIFDFVPPRNQGECYVTFVWKGDGTTTGVTLEAPIGETKSPRTFSLLPGTNVWFRTERVPIDYRFTYDIDPTTNIGGVSHTESLADPLNPKTFLGDSIAEGPSAPDQPWIVRNPGIGTGKLERQTILSTSQGEQRNVVVYLPAAVNRDHIHSLILFLDGDDYISQMSAATTLDNLIGMHRIPPAIAVFVSSKVSEGSPPGKLRTRDYTCNDSFADFLAGELKPWVSRTYGVRLDPEKCAVSGMSLGGLEAAYAGFRHPEAFRRVIAQSGSFFYFRQWPAYEQSPSTQTGWLTQEMARSPKMPLKFWLETGVFEGDGVHEVRRIRDVLIAKGYPVTYSEYSGGHDRVNWRGSLANALIAMLGH